MRINIHVKRISDLNPVFGARSKNVWATIKAATGTRQRVPKSVVVTDQFEAVCANDYDCSKRWAMDLTTGSLSNDVHVSCGEWASLNRGQDKAISHVPANTAVITAIWNDYYRSFYLEVAVNPENLPKQLKVNNETD